MAGGWGERFKKIWKRRVEIGLRRRFRPQTRVRVAGRTMFVDLRDRVIGSLLYIENEYESELQRFIGSLDLEGGVCLDIGANIGLHTLLLSEKAGAAGRVYAFEPEPNNFGLLERNLEANGARNVTAIRTAIGDKPGKCRMAVHPDNFGDHRVSERAPQGALVEVPITTIDAVLRETPLGAVKFIKIDVQGYETYVLRGMSETLRRNPDAVLLMEVFPEGLEAAGSSASELIRLAKELDLDGWEFHDHRLVPLLAPWTYDLIREGKYLDVALSRRAERVTHALEAVYERKLAPSGTLNTAA